MGLMNHLLMLNYDSIRVTTDNLLVASTLLLGFVVMTFYSPTDEAWMTRVDEMHLKGERKADPHYFRLKSFDYYYTANTSVATLFVATWLSLLQHVSFIMACKENDPATVKYWISYGIYFIGLTYILLIIGIVMFYEFIGEFFINMFPMYPKEATSSIFSDETKSSTTGQTGTLIFDILPQEKQLVTGFIYQYEQCAYYIGGVIMVLISGFHVWYMLYDPYISNKITETEITSFVEDESLSSSSISRDLSSEIRHTVDKFQKLNQSGIIDERQFTKILLAVKKRNN